MLQLESISLFIGDRVLLDQVSAVINPGDRIGLVGPNGAGKSTLLKIINGEAQADEGKVHLANDRHIGYLPQDGVDPDPNLTVYGEVESAFYDVLELKLKVDQALEELEKNPVDHPDHAKIVERYGNYQTRLEQSGYYTLRSDIEKVLSGLGFSSKDLERSTTEFSGGWLMRIALAKLLLRKPDVLLLDEPTNHLDIESLQWIESFLKEYEGGIIVVSHDKAFLDSITTRTLALRRGRMYEFAGNYSFYEKKWAEQSELLRRAQENQAQEIKETEKFIERFRYKATKARQVQSRVKALEKIERIELEDDLPEVTFRFPPPERAGKVVTRLEHVRKSYDEHQVFSDLSVEIERGDKIAVVGPNGAGKSTMIRMVAGVEPLSGGDRILGHNVTPSYFAQHQAEELNISLDILDEMKQAGTNASETTMRSILGCFLFSGDDVYKKIKVLSGGEKSRVALAKMLLKSSNLIILDEPTNHLDMRSKEILQQALIQYEGTLLIVSHDRAFLDPIVNKTLEIQHDSAKFYLGNVSWYLAKKQEESSRQNGRSDGGQRSTSKIGSGQPLASGKVTGQSIETMATKNRSSKEQKRLEAERRNELSKRTKPIKQRLQAVEQEIHKLEERKTQLETQMADTSFYEDSEKVKTATAEFEQIRRSLEDAYSKWEELSWRLEGIEEQFDKEFGGQTFN